MKSFALGFILLLPIFILSQKIGDSLDFELYSSRHYSGTITKIENDGYFIKIKNNREIYLSFFEIKSSVKISKTAKSNDTSITNTFETQITDEVQKKPIAIDELIIGDGIDVLLKGGNIHSGKVTEISNDRIVIKTTSSEFKIFFLSQIQEVYLKEKSDITSAINEKADTTVLSDYEKCNCGKSDAENHGNEKGVPFFLAGASIVLSWFPVIALEKSIKPTIKYSPDFSDVTQSKNSYLHKNEVYLRCYRNEVIKNWRISKYTGLALSLFLLIITG
jgi:predicted RNA-binding protein with RPS1 domain